MSIDDKKIAVLDASPVNDPTPWMRQACRKAGVFLAEIDAIAEILARTQGVRQTLIDRGPKGPAPELGPAYLTALDELCAGETRVAVHSVVWVDYGVVPRGAVLDFDPLESERARALAAGLRDDEVTRTVDSVRQLMEHHVGGLRAEHRLVLPAGAAEATKAELAARHLSSCLD